MDNSEPHHPGTTAIGWTEGPEPGRFRLRQLACWLPAAAIGGVVIGWAAVVAERYYAPLVVFPILTGVVLGGVLVALMRLGQVGHRPTLAAGALLAILLAVAGEHYVAFRQTQNRLQREPEKMAMLRLIEQARKEAGEEAPDAIPLPPTDFVGYTCWLANHQGLKLGSAWLRGSVVWWIWALDAILLGIPGLLLVAATARLPYCNHCQRWYHAIRSGKTAPSTTRRLAVLLGLEVPPEIRSARYRLIACQGGCGPTGLVLFWEQPDGSFSSGYIWLDWSGHREVLSVLDEKREE